jgi:hypothetical protein
MKRIGWLLAATLTGLALAAYAQPQPKKLIEYGWDVPQPSYVAANLEQMQKRPFDGLIMRLPDIGSVFHNTRVDEAKPELVKEFEALPQIAWGSFTDNFICMYAASTMDWSSDPDWEAVLQRARLCAKAARVGKCKGVCFDYEPYGDNPWNYSAQKCAKAMGFEETFALARRRGAQFMDALQSEYPGLVVHTFFQFCYFSHIATEPDAAKRMKMLSGEGYGLLPAFINGLLDAAKPDVLLTDGNEGSYYYKEPLAYYKAFHTMRQTALGLVAPENRAKYLAQMQAAQALYVDYVFKYWPNPTPATYLSAEERAKWWEHNVYYALQTSDRYVWLYSEKMNWWTDTNLPPLMEAATAGAREKIARRQPLGFDIGEAMARAREREAVVLREKLGEQKQASISRAAVPPAIDGKLDDAAWQGPGALDAFLPYAHQSDDSVKAKTLAWVTYDDTNLYLAVRCEEPNVNALKLVGSERDHDVWLGDSVDVFLAPSEAPLPFFHLILNADGVRWDARHRDVTDLDTGWNPDYQAGTDKGTGFWGLEMALPWSALGIAPKASTRVLANLCRARHAGGISEHSTWSRCVGGFVEPERFGCWTLR